jgi:molybdate transport system ATP-binding protein/molybdate/tungstate transport system ATP-binding protein
MIKIENIYKDLGEFRLEDVSLDIEDAEYMVILGPTGAGKTILLETLAGIYLPDKGRIYLDNRDITRMPPRLRNIGMVYQDYTLFPHLSVAKNIRFGLRYSNISEANAESKIRELTELLGITHLLHRHPGTLSGGEKQRVAIARALIIEPKLLLFDEPLSALDNETKNKLREELRRIHKITRTTMLHVTHSFNEAFLLGNKMAIMNQGRIIQVGEPGEVFRKPNCRFVADFLGAGNIFQGVLVPGKGLSSLTIDGLTILTTSQISGQVNASIRPEDILVSLKPIESSARNSFCGPIVDISDTGAVVRITVMIGKVPLIASITRRSFFDMELQAGKEVFLTFKTVDVHVF